MNKKIFIQCLYKFSQDNVRDLNNFDLMCMEYDWTVDTFYNFMLFITGGVECLDTDIKIFPIDFTKLSKSDPIFTFYINTDKIKLSDKILIGNICYYVKMSNKNIHTVTFKALK